MNLFLINKEFEKLSKIDNYINYKFEPRYKIKNCNRHIYFNDLKKDFEDEINTYGFSPFIQDTYINQKKDKNIMSYKTHYTNKGLTNYVKKKNHLTKEKENINRPIINVRTSRSLKKTNEENLFNVLKNVDSIDKRDENFLKKALDNLSKNRMNTSSVGFQFTDDEEQQSSKKNYGETSKLNQNYRIKNSKSSFLDYIGLRTNQTRPTSEVIL